ncbi:MAG TPA: response regulator [Verrucomicrobiae bacterium]|jgi:CheY-like chemotaxis protein
MNINAQTVLLAEDDPNDVFLFKHAFESARVDNRLQVVNDGQQAIDYLSGAGEFADRDKFPFPTLLVLDVKMPRKTGIEVLQWLKKQENLSCLPTIMLSSSANPEDVENTYRLGVNAFVVKPQGTESRVDLAKLIKGFWLTFNELPNVCR